MSGYLQNIARRAIGRATPVRSRAALPFASSGPVFDEGPFESAVESRRSNASARDPSPDAAQAPLGAPELTIRHPAGRAEESDVVEDLEVASGHVRPEGQRARSPFLPETGTPPQDERDDENGTDTRRPRSWDPQRVPVPLAGPRGEALEGRAVAVRPFNALVTVPADLRPGSSERVLSPAPLREASARAATAESPEIHVSIGRIELTAVASPSPARPPPAASKAMSLSEYEEKRRRRER